MNYDNFLAEVDGDNIPFVDFMHNYMTENGFDFDIQNAKSGYVVSYKHTKSKKTLLNYVFRKNGIQVRIYADNLNEYKDILNSMPESLIKKVSNSSDCRRLHDPDKCNPRCPMGYSFELKGDSYKKCRYMCFLLPLKAENHNFLKLMLEREVLARSV